MDVEEGHDVQAAVGPPEPEGLADVLGGRADVAVEQGHQLGPRCRAGGVEEEGDVIRSWSLGGGASH